MPPVVRASCVIVVAVVATAGGATASSTQRSLHAEHVAPRGAAPLLAVSDSGDVAAAWFNGTGLVESAFRALGSRWNAPTLVARGGPWQLAIDGRGNTTLLWSSSAETPGTKVLVAVRSREGGTWGEPSELSGWQRDRFIGSPALDVNRAGDGISAFWDGGLKTSFRPRDGEWQEPQPLSTPPGTTRADVALDGAGNAFAVWDTLDQAIYVSRRAAVSGVWSPPVRLTPAGRRGLPRLAVNERGDAAVVWISYSGAWQGAAAAFWSREQATWSAPQTLGEAPYLDALVALDETGNATVVGVPPPHLATARLDLFERGSGDAAWRGALTLALTRHPTDLALVAGGDGRAAVSWVADDTLFVAQKKRTGTWTATRLLFPAWGTDIGLTRTGDVVLAYSYGGSANENKRGVFVGALDVTPPRIVRAAVPRRAHAGQRVRFSVSASDEWSALRRPRWRFGDGARAVGSRAWHSYRRTGTYGVVVTVRDAAGNAVSSGATIRVTG